MKATPVLLGLIFTLNFVPVVLCQEIYDFNPITKESRKVELEKLVPYRVYIWQNDSTEKDILSVSLKSLSELGNTESLMSKYEKYLPTMQPSSEVAILSPFPLTDGTVLPGAFFGLLGQDAIEKFLYQEKLITKPDGSSYLQVEWTRLGAEQKHTTPVIRFLNYGWAMKSQQDIRLQDLELQPLELLPKSYWRQRSQPAGTVRIPGHPGLWSFPLKTYDQ